MTKIAYIVEPSGHVTNAIVIEDHADPSQFNAIIPPEGVVLAVGGTYVNGVAYGTDGKPLISE